MLCDVSDFDRGPVFRQSLDEWRGAETLRPTARVGWINTHHAWLFDAEGYCHDIIAFFKHWHIEDDLIGCLLEMLAIYAY